MTDQNNDPLSAAIAKAESDPAFTQEEVVALKKVADAWRGLESLGRVANVARSILVYVGWAVALWLIVKQGMASFLSAGK